MRHPERVRESGRRWTEKPGNRAKRKAATKRWRQRNLETHRYHRQEYYDRHKEQIRQRSLNTRVALVGRQAPEACELCNRKLALVADHDHGSGRYRGWICRLCNAVIGFTEENPELLRRIAAWIENGNGRT